MTPSRTHLVLGGGGALGAFQAGMLAALLEDGIRPDALYGCSAGALNAAFLAVDPSPERAHELAGFWTDPATHRILAPPLLTRLRGASLLHSLRAGALLDVAPLRRLVARQAAAHDLSELAVPVTVTTTCLDCAAAVHHRRGPTVDVLLASASLPGLFPPVRLGDGHLHVDGGVLAGVPLGAALAAAGPEDRVLVLDCGLDPVTAVAGRCAAGGGLEDATSCGLGPADRAYTPPVEGSRGVLDVLLRAFTVARSAANRAAVAAGLDDPRVEVLPHVADAWATGLLNQLPRGPRDLAAAGALVDAGRAAAAGWAAIPAPRTG